MIETRRRTIADVRTLRFLARQIGLPVRYLGVADLNDGYDGMLSFGASVLRLAVQARQTGRVKDAIRELWPLVTRLEDYLEHHGLDEPTARLLIQAQQALGTSLGYVLPEEKLRPAILWTGKAWALAKKLNDSELRARAATAYGNELRKGGRLRSAERKTTAPPSTPLLFPKYGRAPCFNWANRERHASTSRILTGRQPDSHHSGR